MNRTRKLSVTLGLALLLIGTSVNAGSPDPVGVDKLASKIQRKLSSLYQYGVFDNIEFSIEGSMVTLSGQVSRPSLMKSAVRTLMRTEGVGEVVNDLEVLPNSREDDRIRRRVYENIYGNTVLSRYDPSRGTPVFPSQTRRHMGISYDPPIGVHPIHIIVRNGHVTLVGAVANQGDRTIASVEANATRGVFSVQNNLRTP